MRATKRQGPFVSLKYFMATAIALVACGAYDQQVRGRLLYQNKPVVSSRIRFLSSGPKEICDAPGLKALTDAAGAFTVHQAYTPSIFENFAVAIHPYRLCVERNGRWERVWSAKSGPAPRTLDIECKLGGIEATQCRSSWNGQRLGKWQTAQ